MSADRMLLHSTTDLAWLYLGGWEAKSDIHEFSEPVDAAGRGPGRSGRSGVAQARRSGA